jgi:hypothetical protein
MRIKARRFDATKTRLLIELTSAAALARGAATERMMPKDTIDQYIPSDRRKND